MTTSEIIDAAGDAVLSVFALSGLWIVLICFFAACSHKAVVPAPVAASGGCFPSHVSITVEGIVTSDDWAIGEDGSCTHVTTVRYPK